MEKKMTFNYFYGTEADQFSFYRIPYMRNWLLMKMAMCPPAM